MVSSETNWLQLKGQTYHFFDDMFYQPDPSVLHFLGLNPIPVFSAVFLHEKVNVCSVRRRDRPIEQDLDTRVPLELFEHTLGCEVLQCGLSDVHNFERAPFRFHRWKILERVRVGRSFEAG